MKSPFLTLKDLYKQANRIGKKQVFLGSMNCVAGQLLQKRFPDCSFSIGRNPWFDFLVHSKDDTMKMFSVPDSFGYLIQRMSRPFAPTTGTDVMKEMRKMCKKSHKQLMA